MTIIYFCSVHNLPQSFTKPFFSPSEPISVYLPPYGPHLCMSSQFSFYTFKFGVLFCLSFFFPALSLFSFSLFISGSPGSSQDPCKEHVSHDTTATNAINKVSNKSRARERERVYSNTSSLNTVNRDWEIKREIKLGWDLLNLQTVYFKNMGNQKERHQKLYFAYRIIKNSAYSGQFLHYEIIFD